MSPEDLVRALCARHALPIEAGNAFLPEVRAALRSSPDARDRILAAIELRLAERAHGEARPGGLTGSDESVLLAVSRVLHDWTPSEAMLDLGSSLGRKPGDPG